MTRRIAAAIIGTVVATLLLVGVGTLALARVGAARTVEDEVRRQADTTAQLIALSQTGSAQLGTDDLAGLRLALCDLTVGDRVDVTTRTELDQLKFLVCTGGEDRSLADARTAVCEQAPPRLTEDLPPEVRTALDDFCADATETTLAGLRTAACEAAGDTGPRSSDPLAQRVARARRIFCAALERRTVERRQLERTLAGESIALVAFGPDGTPDDPGAIPAGIPADAIDVAALRAGATVSGASATGQEVWAVAPVNPDGETVVTVVIERPVTGVAGRSAQWFLLASLVVLLVAALVAAWLSRRLTQPLRHATEVTASIAGGDLGARLPEAVTGVGPPRDELQSLGQSINAMADSLARSRGLEQQFLLSISHDLRTPLTSIRGYAEAIADGAAPDAGDAAEIILTESRRLERLVADLLDLAKLDARRFDLHLRAVDLVEVAADSVDGFRREVEAAGLRIELDVPGVAVPAVVDPDRLQQVVANLVENALKFASGGITVAVTPGDGAGGPRLEVADDGPGIAAEDLPHVFERLYVASATPRRKETGSGLGLAIARELVEAMGGTIAATAATPSGARIVVRFPSTATPPDHHPPAPETPA